MVRAFAILAVMVTAAPADPYARCPLIRIAADGTELRLGMARAQVEALVGNPERTELGSPEYLSRGFALMYDESGRLAAILAGQSSAPGLLSEAFTGSVAGVRMGSTRAEMELLLGEPDAIRSEGGLELLKYGKTGLTFSLANGRVHHFSVSRSCVRPGA